MSGREQKPVRLEGKGLFARLRLRDPAAIWFEDLRKVLDDTIKHDEQKVRELARMLRLKLLPLPKRPAWQTRNRALDRSSQWWRTLDLLAEAIQFEEFRRQRLRNSEVLATEEIHARQPDRQGLAKLLSTEETPSRHIATTVYRPPLRGAPSSKPRRRTRVQGIKLKRGERLLPFSFEDEGGKSG